MILRSQSNEPDGQGDSDGRGSIPTGFVLVGCLQSMSWLSSAAASWKWNPTAWSSAPVLPGPERPRAEFNLQFVLLAIHVYFQISESN